LLGLFIPWNQLLSLFQRYAAKYKTKRDTSTYIWKIVEPTLSLYNYNFARNIELLQKLKEDCQIDTVLQKLLYNQLDSLLDYNIDNIELTNLDLDIEEPNQFINKDLNTEILIAVYHSIVKL
jgi:hypothetical protein